MGGHYSIAMAGHAAITLAMQGAGDELSKQPIPPEPVPEAPPRRLSNDPNHADFHPSYMRVGVRIDGQERRDCVWFDADRGRYLTLDTGRKAIPLEAAQIEPYWRWSESRQERRARERWERKRK